MTYSLIPAVFSLGASVGARGEGVGLVVGVRLGLVVGVGLGLDVGAELGVAVTSGVGEGFGFCTNVAVTFSLSFITIVIAVFVVPSLQLWNVHP